MKFRIVLLKDAEGKYWLRTPRERPVRVCSAAEACRRLGKTRRQVYRYIRSGWLENRGKVLGEWLLDEESVTRLAASPPQVQPLPRRLKSLFPEYDVAGLNAGKDKTLVMGRILDAGGLEDLRWLMRRYQRGVLERFVREEGARRLCRRSRRLWSLYFGVRPRPAPDWRGSGPWEDRFHYPYPLCGKPEPWKDIPVASDLDIGAMKLSAIVGRGSRKDFLDLFWICRKTGLGPVLDAAAVKFRDHKDFFLQASRALVYFEDAQREPPPRLLRRFSWREAKSFFASEVPKVLRKRIR